MPRSGISSTWSGVPCSWCVVAGTRERLDVRGINGGVSHRCLTWRQHRVETRASKVSHLPTHSRYSALKGVNTAISRFMEESFLNTYHLLVVKRTNDDEFQDSYTSLNRSLCSSTLFNLIQLTCSSLSLVDLTTNKL